MTDGTVGVIDHNSSGIKIVDTSEFVNDEGVTVERQRMVIGDPALADNLAPVSRYTGVGVRILDGGLVQDVLEHMLLELRAIRVGMSELCRRDLLREVQNA